MTLGTATRKRLAEHAEHLAANEPGLALQLDEKQRSAAIRGVLLVEIGGTIRKPFDIEITYQRLDPFKTPITRDPVRRFPPAADRHVFPDGMFCMWLPQADPGDFGTPDGLALHLHRVRQFIVLQLMYEQRKLLNIKPRWAGPEWAHDVDGHKQWVREQLIRYPPCDLGLFTRDIAGGRRGTSPDKPCPCRSGQIYRRCHLSLVETLRQSKKDPGADNAIAAIIKEHRMPDPQPDDESSSRPAPAPAPPTADPEDRSGPEENYTPPATAPASPVPRGIEFGWKVHNAQEAWTARIDSKAALYLAAQTAVLVTTAAAFATNKSLGALTGTSKGVAIFGALISMLAVIVAGSAVVPLLGRTKHHRAVASEHLIYFGHLRHRTAKDVQDSLAALTHDQELGQISLQLIALAQRNWDKHQRLQAAMTLGAVGTLVVLVTYLVARF